jgi:hypothetical protein
LPELHPEEHPVSTPSDDVPTDYVEWLKKKIRIYEAAEWHEDAERVREELAAVVYERAAIAEAAERNERYEPPRCPHDTLDVELCAEGGHDQ